MWQFLLSAGRMLVTAYGIIRAVAAMFRAQNLLSRQPLSVKRFFGALLRRAWNSGMNPQKGYYMTDNSYLGRLLLLCLVVAFLAGCAGATPEPQPYWPTEEWRTSTPEQQGMDSEMLADMLETIQEQDYDIDSVSVVRNGYVVVETTVHPFKPGSRHIIYSCTKSIISALIGIAIDKDYIEGIEQPVLSFFPERTVANLDANKEAMTLEHRFSHGYNRHIDIKVVPCQP